MKGKLWLLIPIITVMIVIATIAFLYLQPKSNESEFTVTPPPEKIIQYKDYLGKWLNGKTVFEDLLPEQGGSLIEIREITDQLIKGTYTAIFKKGAKKSIAYVFYGRVKGDRADIKYIDETSRRWNGIITLKGEKIGVQLNLDPNLKKRDREIIFGRADIQAKTASFQEILGYLSLSRNEIVKKLGGDYKVLPSGIQGTNDGYFYPKRSVVIVFENGKTKERIAWVDCKEAVDINGVKAGSSFDEIRSKLGDAPLIETWEGTPDHQVYRLQYYVPHAEICFQSESKNGDYSKVFIIRK